MARFCAHEIYRDLLSKLSKGVPLWVPEPELRNLQNRSGGEVQIGDVGFFEDGRFVRLLNVTEERYGEDNIDGPPEDQEPLRYDPRLMRTLDAEIQPGLYGNGFNITKALTLNASGNAVVVPAGAGAACQFMTNKAMGAMLLLPEPASSKQVSVNMVFPKYMQQHHASWVQYARKIGFACKPEDIVLVRGALKTSNWTVGAFQQDSRSARAALHGSFTPVASVGFDLSLGEHNACHKDSRSRPLLPNTILSDEPLSRDQSVFLRVYILKQRLLRVWLPPKVMEAGAGPHQLPRHDDDDGPAGTDTQIVSDPESTFRYIPVDIVLDYILQSQPEAEFAIACEDDITDMLGGAPWPEDLAGYLAEHRPEIYVDPETKLGMLSIEDAIQRSRTEVIQRNIQAAQNNNQMNVDDEAGAGDEAMRGVNPLGDGELILGNRLPQGRPVKWPHVALIDSSAEGSAVSSITLAPDGEHIATGMDDSVIRIWNYRTGDLRKKLNGHDDTPWSLSYSPDGHRLVSGSGDNIAIIWDTNEGAEQPELGRLLGHTSDVWSVAFSPDGRFIATASTDSSVRVWDPNTRVQLHSFLAEGSSVMQVLWTPDSKRIVSCGELGGRCWDVEAAQQIMEFRGHDGAIWCMNISKQGDRLITGSEDHTARVWDIRTGQELVTLSEHDGAIWAVGFSDDGQEVVFGGYDNRVVVADSFTGETKHVWAGDGGGDEEIIVDTVSFSRAGDLIAAGAADGNVRLYNNRTGDFIVQYSAHTDKVKNVQFARDDMDIISSSDDGSVRVFNLVDTLKIGL